MANAEATIITLETKRISEHNRAARRRRARERAKEICHALAANKRRLGYTQLTRRERRRKAWDAAKAEQNESR